MIFAHYFSSRAALTLMALFFSGSVLAADSSWQLEAGWVRAVPPNARTTAAYLQVLNHAAKPLTIIAARTSASDRTEVHDMLHENGLMKMVKLERLEVAAQSTLSLAPGGKHVMLMDLEQVPQEGSSVEVCLADTEGLERCLSLPVQRSAPSAENSLEQRHSEHHH